MFQDEARFGRMARPKRCWASKGCRPVMANGYEREFTYVYGGVSPLEGEMDWMLCTEMNTERMGEFLTQVSTCHPDDFILLVLDGASSHKAKALVVPANVRLIPRPPYAPELNPQEHLWMNSGRRSSPTGFTTAWRRSSPNCRLACPASATPPRQSDPSPRGHGF